MKNILFLSVNFPPMLTEGSARAFRLFTKFQELGWAPVVVAPAEVAWDESDACSVGSELSGYSGIYRTGEVIAASTFGPERAAQLVQGNTALPLNASPLRMISAMLPGTNLVSGWEKQAASIVADIIARYDTVDAIYAQGPPAAPLHLALDISAKHGIPVIFDLVAPVDGFSLPGSSRQYLAKIEERVVTSGHTIMTPTRALKEYFLKKYFGKVTHDDISIVSDFCLMPAAIASMASQKRDGGMLLLVFADHRVQGKDLKRFMQALGAFTKQPAVSKGAVSVRLISSSLEESHKYIRKYLQDAPVSCSHRLQDKEELDAVAQCDIFCLIGGADESSRLILPERLLDALCMNRKLLVVGPDSPASQLALESGGFAASLNDVPAVIKALQAAADDSERAEQAGGSRPPVRYTADASDGDLAKLLAYLLPV